MSLSEIVNVSITRQTKSVSRAGFGVVLIAAPHVVTTNRVDYYTSATAMTDAGFETTDPVYIAGSAAFAQNPAPTKIAVGRRQVDSVGVSIDNVVDNTQYTVTINGTDFSFTSSGTATDTGIATGLVSAINAGSEPVTATDDADGTLTLDADVSGTAFSVSVDSNQSIEKPLTAADTITNDLDAIKTEDDDWYGLVVTDHTQSVVESAASWTETNKKLFISSSDASGVLDSGSTTDVAYNIQNSSYDRTAIVYNATPADFPEAAWFGRMLPKDPGSATWAYKTLSGISADDLTATQSKAVHDKDANTYEAIGGVNVTRYGTVGSGEYLDVIRGIDWLEARMQERIYSRLVNNDKIPYTNKGIAVIENEIRGQLQDGIAAGLLASDPAFTVTVPDSADVSSTDKANRELNNVEFEATLAGAVHKITIQGVVTL